MSNPSPTSSSLASTLLNRMLARTRLRQLQLLVRAAELGSIQRAGGEIGMSQPAATKAVAELEQLVGTDLFERHARGVRPTAVCRELLPLLRSMLRVLNDCAESLAAHVEGGQELVRIGAITGAITGLLGECLPAFAKQHPHLRVEVTEDAPHALQAGFAEGLFDLLLMREPASLAAGHRFVPLRQDQALVFGRQGHPLGRRRELGVEELLEQEWILPPLGSQMRQAFERLFEACGRLPARTPVTTRSLPMLLLLLQEHEALSLAPSSFMQPFVAAGLLQVLKVRMADVLPPIGMLISDSATKQSVILLSEFLQQRRSPCLSASV